MPSTGIGAPTDRPDRIAERFVGRWARGSSTSSTSTARGPAAPANLEAVGAIAARVAVPLQLAGGVDTADAIRLAFAAGATRVVLTTAIADRPDDLRACLAVAGDWLAVGLDPRPERLAAFPWRRADPPTVDGLVGELVGAGVARFVLSHGGGRAGPRRAPASSFGRTMPRSWSPAGSTISTASAACATPASPVSSSARPSSPGPSTIPPPWRPPHDPRRPEQPGRLPRGAAAPAH